MSYSKILCETIAKSGLKITNNAKKVEDLTGTRPTNNYLSKFQNGKTSPAGDILNTALAMGLETNPIELKTASYQG